MNAGWESSIFDISCPHTIHERKNGATSSGHSAQTLLNEHLWSISPRNPPLFRSNILHASVLPNLSADLYTVYMWFSNAGSAIGNVSLCNELLRDRPKQNCITTSKTSPVGCELPFPPSVIQWTQRCSITVCAAFGNCSQDWSSSIKILH